MTANYLLESLLRLNFTLTVRDNQLIVKPGKELDSELIDLIKQHKPGLLALVDEQSLGGKCELRMPSVEEIAACKRMDECDAQPLSHWGWLNSDRMSASWKNGEWHTGGIAYVPLKK